MASLQTIEIKLKIENPEEFKEKAKQLYKEAFNEAIEETINIEIPYLNI